MRFRAWFTGAVALASLALSSPAVAAGPWVPAPATGPEYRNACSIAPEPGYASCLALVRTDLAGTPATALAPDAVPAGLGPADLAAAYALDRAAGAGLTVAVVDAYDLPTAERDLATYRSQYGLPACTSASGCLRTVNQTGGSALPAANASWGEEIALDLDMVSAACPSCKILLVEASSTSDADLGKAVNEAVALGANAVSNSYGGPESSADTSTYDAYYNHPGVAITVSSGDNGYGTEFPAASQYVTSVGGTSLRRATGTGRGWSEAAWTGAGSGCSTYDPRPAWQTAVTQCARKAVADVSAVADPSTGVAVYDSTPSGGQSGWLVFGGTSASAPIVAGIYLLAGPPAAGTYPASYPWAHAGSAALNGVASGSNGSCSPAIWCTAAAGWDGPTGLGTPNGSAAFSATTTAATVTVTAPGNQSTATGTAVSLQIRASDSAGAALSYGASGLPAGLSISASTGLVSGTPTTAGTFAVTVTAKDASGATGSTSFTWTVTSAGAAACPARQLLGNPGFETGTAAPWTASAGVLDSSSGEPAHSGSWKTWLNGYGSSHVDTLSQPVTVPSGCSSYTFSLYLHIDTRESSTSTAYDRLTVQVTSGGSPVTLATYSNLNHGTGYAKKSFDLSAYAGRTVTLKLTGTEDSSRQTSFVVDDASVSVS